MKVKVQVKVQVKARTLPAWRVVGGALLAGLLTGLLAGCGGASVTPNVIYVTATPAPVAELPSATPNPAATALFGPPGADTPEVTFRPLPTFTRAAPTLPPPSLTPTFTPEFTDTPPAPPASAGPAPSCALRMQPNGFTTLYQRDAALRTALGCPLSAPVAVSSASLPFDNGQMLWVSSFADQPQKMIYALFSTGAYGRFPDTWVEGADPADTGEAAPAGKNAPVRGFGKVWKNNPTVRGLGWALGAERGTAGQIQRFERGEMLFVADLGQTFIFTGGRWRADGTPF